MLNFRLVLTLANSIIGVSILAMPFCFKQCGVILATFTLIISGFIVRLMCHLLLKAANIARRGTYEALAFHVFGHAGKFAVELNMIGFLIGTCVAFFVVIGDLGPPLIAESLGIENTHNLRLTVLLVLGIFVVLPLALLRDIRSLSGISTVSIVFYSFIVGFIIFNSRLYFMDGSWISNINLWQPVGIPHCFPIFCMALSCQAQIFEIYAALPEASLTNMNLIIKNAVNLCCAAYICVGIFGYIVFSGIPFGGNILAEFPPSVIVSLLKMGFVLSVAMSFPLVIFPCRSAIHSLLFRKVGISTSDSLSTTHSPNYISAYKFYVITTCVVLTTLIVGIMVPDIELVLSFVGSTIGCVICIIFPSVLFTKLTTRNTTERVCAQTMFVVGVCLMSVGTYVSLSDKSLTKDAFTISIDIPTLKSVINRKPMILSTKITLENNVSNETVGSRLKLADKLIKDLSRQKEENEKIIKEQKIVLEAIKKVAVQPHKHLDDRDYKLSTHGPNLILNYSKSPSSGIATPSSLSSKMSIATRNHLNSSSNLNSSLDDVRKN